LITSAINAVGKIASRLGDADGQLSHKI
jgi:hypothetical protein